MMFKLISRRFCIKFIFLWNLSEDSQNNVKHQGGVCWTVQLYSHLLFGKFHCVTWCRVEITSLPGADLSLNPHFPFISWEMWQYRSNLTACATVSAVLSNDNWRLPPTPDLWFTASQGQAL
jgi:hypothetical protein